MIAFLAVAAIAPADMVIENARIWSDGRAGFAHFAAVSRGRFVYVGEPQSIYIGPKTARIDAKDRVVIPGLIDSHVHMLGGGTNLSQLQLRDAKDKTEFIKRVAAWTSALPAGKWVLGGRWSVESWAAPEQPTKEWVDSVTADRPLFLSRMDGHSGLVNSAALKMAGVTRSTPNPPGGIIDRDAGGEPTGILRDNAMGLVTRLIPQPSIEDKVGALKKAMAHANRNGITAVSDIPGLGDLPAYEQLAKSGLTVRFSLYPTAENWDRAAETAKLFNGRVSSFLSENLPTVVSGVKMAAATGLPSALTKSGVAWMQVRGFKAYFDGSLGSRTAYMREPYFNNPPDKPDWRGIPMPGAMDGTFMRNAKVAQRTGLQSIVHAIGDEANNLLLNQLFEAYPNIKTARCRSEHAQHFLPGDIPRMGRLGVIASMQPYQKADDGRYAESYIGEERCRSSYAYKSLIDEGVVLAFGSDWPVVSIDPFLGVEAAVTGKTLAGKFWQTQENITVAEALRSYTSRGAYAMFMENEIGKIERGFRADFVILDRSPFDKRAEWADMSPDVVYVEGRKVYSKSGRG